MAPLAAPQRPRLRFIRFRPEYAAIAVLAFVARMLVPLLGGGLRGLNSNDPGVYYAAADALTHGLLPYRDFVLVHPPLIAYLLTPFAVIGRLTTDQIGLAAAGMGFAALGAINAVLVAHTARCWGVRGRASLCAGLAYALCYAAIAAEYSSRLEPPGNTLLILALLALAPTAGKQPENRPSHPLLAGLALGAAVSLKIWWVVPAALLLLTTLARSRGTEHRWAPSVRMVIGGLTAAVVIDAIPFFSDPAAMFRLVVLQQLGRRRMPDNPLERMAILLGVGHAQPIALAVVAHVVAAVAAIALVWAATRATRTPLGRVTTPLLAVQTALLLVSPSWFSFYGDYTAVAIALTVAAAMSAATSADQRIRLSPGAIVVSLVAVLGLGALATSAPNAVKPVRNRRQLLVAAAHYQCIMAESPVALIAVNALDRSFGPTCRNWVDVRGLDLDNGSVGSFSAVPAGRHRWGPVFRDYLASGNAVILRPTESLPRDVRALLKKDRLVVRGRTVELYQNRDARPRSAVQQ